MCYVQVKNDKLHKVHNSDGEINEETPFYIPSEIPEHVDNAMLNRNVQTGILGFRYETKSEMFVMYTSVEAKTFCILMRLEPVHN